jgi:hypothetical protein
MNTRIRAILVSATLTLMLALSATAVPAAHAGLLSILPGSCGSQSASQPFARWADSRYYALMPGGSFEAGSPGWLLWRGAKVSPGNESFYVNSPTDSQSLALPTGSSATSPPACTSIHHPTMRFFLRNTGSASSRLKVEALYPGLLGGVQVARIGVLTGSAAWKPSPVVSVQLSNLLATLSLDRTTIAFRFTPLDGSGAWSIDDVYLDPRMR